MTEHHGSDETPIDLSRLSPCERRVWDEFFSGPLPDGEGPAIRVWSFGYACMLECSGPPEVVTDYLAEHDPENTIRQYLDNVRRARRSGEL